MLEESTENLPTADFSFGPKQIGQFTNLTVNVNVNFLRQDSISFIHVNVINSYIAYELET